MKGLQAIYRDAPHASKDKMTLYFGPVLCYNMYKLTRVIFKYDYPI